MTSHTEVVLEVEKEILRAKSLHPGDFTSIHEGYAVLLEEVDELWDEVKFNPKKGIDRSNAIAVELAKQAHRDRMRKEAIHVAAMAIRFASELT